MSVKFRGFATLTALALLTLLVVYLSGATTFAFQAQRDWERVTPSREAQVQAWKALDSALTLMTAKWNPTLERLSSWAEGHRLPGVSWEALSGKVNLNTVSPFVLALDGFRSTLKGVSVAQFVAAREIRGPVSEIAGYTDLITAEALASWYTVHGRWNLNTADEVLLEKIVSARTGTPAIGSAVRSTVRSFRERKVAITAGDWERVVGNSLQELGPVVTLEPELDVNEAPELILAALLTNPAWQVEEPLAKVATLVNGRAVTPWSARALRDVLKVSDSSVLLSYLGTKTAFVEVRYESQEGILSWILSLEEDSQTGSVKPRIVESKWSQA